MSAILDLLRSAAGVTGNGSHDHDHDVNHLERALRTVAKAVLDDTPHCHRRKRQRTSTGSTDSVASTDLRSNGTNVHVVCVGGGSLGGGELDGGHGTSIPTLTGIKVGEKPKIVKKIF